jgi:hypothetical protein
VIVGFHQLPETARIETGPQKLVNCWLAIAIVDISLKSFI